MKLLKVCLIIYLLITGVSIAKGVNQEVLIKQSSELLNMGLDAYESMNPDPELANKYFQKSLAIRKNIYGKEHTEVAKIYYELGQLYYTIGSIITMDIIDRAKAVEYYQKALTIFVKTQGEYRAEIATIFNRLVQLYPTIAEDTPKTMAYFKKALGAFEKTLVKDNIEAAEIHKILGSVYKEMNEYLQAIEHYQKASTIFEKESAKDFEAASIYQTLSWLYKSVGEYSKAIEYEYKSIPAFEKAYSKRSSIDIYSRIGSYYLAMRDYSNALEHFQKALTIKIIFPGGISATNNDEVYIYNQLGWLYETTGDYPKALEYYQKSSVIATIMKERQYEQLGRLYGLMGDLSKAHYYANLAFNIFQNNLAWEFLSFDFQQKEEHLKSTGGYISLLLEVSIKYFIQLKKEKRITESQQVLKSVFNAWLNYNGSVFDSENTIAMLYSNTKDTKLKVKIDELANLKRNLSKLYQTVSKPSEHYAKRVKIEHIEAKIGQYTRELAFAAQSFKEQQGLKSINYKNITKNLKPSELYIDYAKTGKNYYLFSLDSKENIALIQIDKSGTKKINNLIKTFREDINSILKSKNLTDKKLKELDTASKEKLSKLYELVLKEPLEDTIKDKTSLIISQDGALRLLPFEALYDKANNKYFIEEKEIRYIPSGRELVRLYRYSKDKVAQSTSVIFANPNFNTKIVSVSKEQRAITPNTNRSGIIKSLFRMRFAPLPGTEAEAKAIKATLNQKSILEYQTNKATESTLMKVKEPKILHIATHGFFINDNTIPNPMLKSGIALAGANASAIKGKSDGIVTALKLSGLDLKGTDLVVLSACQTGVVDINSTDSVSGLSKAFIQAGAKDIVMSLWSVDDQATKDLMKSFYQEMKENKNYAKALKSAKLKMIEEGRHPFYWAAFVLNGM